MAEPENQVPVKKETSAAKTGETGAHPSAWEAWRPVESLRHEIDRLFEEFNRGFSMTPFRRSFFDLSPLWRRERASTSELAAPAVDVAETDKAYEIKAELPGLDEKDVEVKLVNGGLTIKGEKHEEKEEKQKDYYLHERRFGSFERYFQIPEGVDSEKIEATFSKGVLTVMLPKTPEAQKPEKTIPVKGA